MKRVFKDCVEPLALGTLLWISFALSACTLPVSPGCSADKSLPQSSELFLTLLLVTEDPRGPSFAIDRAGRSEMAGGYTVWMLTPYSRCRSMASEDVDQLEDAWRRAAENPGENAEKRPAPPFVAGFFFTSAGERHRLYVKPDRPGQSAELEHALALTAKTLQEVYGNRVLREFEITRLADLLTPPADEGSLDMHP